jgi:hypothetical protein
MIKNLNILKILFDIRPVDSSGNLSIEKIESVSAELNLKLFKEKKNKKSPEIIFNDLKKSKEENLELIFKPNEREQQKKEQQISSLVKTNFASNIPDVFKIKKPNYFVDYFKLNSIGVRSELEKYLNSQLNVNKELKAIGAKIENNKIGKPRIRPIFLKHGLEKKINRNEEASIASSEMNDDDYYYDRIISQINKKLSPIEEIEAINKTNFDNLLKSENNKKISLPESTNNISLFNDVRSSPEIEKLINFFQSNQGIESVHNFYSKPKSDFKKFKNFNFGSFLNKILKKRVVLAVGVIIFSSFFLNIFNQYGLSLKDKVIKEGDLAVANLEKAGDNLKIFDFKAASSNFAAAYKEFVEAGNTLDFIGANLTSFFAELPGGTKLKSAKNLVEAGKLLAEAGQFTSEAVHDLSNINFILKTSEINNVGADNIFINLKKSLFATQKNLSKASALLLKVEPNILPENKKNSFNEFKSRLPEIEALVADAIDYVNFFENFVGFDKTNKYLILFQNNSELRPTGGFPGTYAIITFKDGKFADFLVDDIYNLDGQLKENIIPPKQLQHITPNWGMRDANWFIDFSVSAQKIAEFFKKEAGYDVNGVITMGPRIISEILKIIGPIEMSEYGYTIDYENFLTVVQVEVEYGSNREQPKQIVKDLAPKLLEKIHSVNSSQWLNIFNIFISGLERKDILMYFRDINMQSFVAQKGFAGLVSSTSEDYLMATFTNVKGSKTDRVINNSIKLSSRFDKIDSKPVIIHKLKITREHMGGDSEYGFYNKQNPSYVRILVPEKSELLNISGNSNLNFKPLIDYTNTDFKKDYDLSIFESNFNFDKEKGVSVYKESGKKGFAFWLVVDPRKSKTVELEYAVPLDNMQNNGDYSIVIQKQPGLEVKNFEFEVNGSNIYNGVLERDLKFNFKID